MLTTITTITIDNRTRVIALYAGSRLARLLPADNPDHARVTRLMFGYRLTVPVESAGVLEYRKV